MNFATPLVLPSNNIPLSLIESHILASYVSCKTTKEQVERYPSMLKQNTFIPKIIKAGPVVSVEDLYQKHIVDIKKSGVLAKIIIEKLYLMEEATTYQHAISRQ